MKLYFQSAAMTALMISTALLMGCSGAHDDDHHDEGHHDKDHAEAAHEDAHEDHEEDHGDDSDGEATVRQVGSHVHGDALLALALDGSTLTAELESPLFNLLGFEHAPDTKAEQSTLKQAEAALANPAALLMFNPEAGCAVQPMSGPVTLFPDAHDDDHHDDDDHDDDHDDDEHTEHAEDEHQDVILEYVYTCANPAKLSFVKTQLFTLFPNLSELETVYLGAAVQKQTILKPGKNRLDLTK